jgi:hypothetical protein
MEPNEDPMTFAGLPAETVLTRWVNYHLKKSSSKNLLQNLSVGGADLIVRNFLFLFFFPKFFFSVSKFFFFFQNFL